MIQKENFIMKKLISVFLMVIMLLSVVSCTAYAEDLSKYTADELAYFAYRDIEMVYSGNSRYMRMLRGLWGYLLDVQTWDDINLRWLSDYKRDERERGLSFSLIWSIEKEKFKDADSSEQDELLISAIKNARQSTDPMETREILLRFGDESGCFLRPVATEVILEYAMKDIRMIMQIDPNYANLDILKDYYKEASSYYKYRTTYPPDFGTFSSKVDEYLEDYDSWEIDFSLIFDKNDKNIQEINKKYNGDYYETRQESVRKRLEGN